MISAATMKKLFSVFVILCWLSMPTHAQVGPPPRQPNPGVLETYKIGFITNRLLLTPEEAQRFWPLYRFYSGEVKQAYIMYRGDKNELQLEENLLNIKKKYSVEFLKAIPPPKINEFFIAEKDFQAFIQKEWQRRHMQGGPYPQ
jgi:hypothetical protein